MMISAMRPAVVAACEAQAPPQPNPGRPVYADPAPGSTSMQLCTRARHADVESGVGHSWRRTDECVVPYDASGGTGGSVAA
jgi:hypothetical protein